MYKEIAQKAIRTKQSHVQEPASQSEFVCHGLPACVACQKPDHV